MDESLLTAIRGRAVERSSRLSFPPASAGDIAAEEAALGFPVPELLRAVYLLVGNGGFGPGRGGNFVGVRGGYPSDFGTLAETYAQLRRDAAAVGEVWPAGLLPFCEWGCNLFTCAGCQEPGHPLYWSEDCVPSPCGSTLDDFLRTWAAGADVFSLRTAAGRGRGHRKSSM